MKKVLLTLFSTIYLFTAQAGFGIWASAVYINVNGTSQFYSTSLLNDPNSIGSVNFGSNLGTFLSNSGNLLINGAEIKTYKDNGGNVCGGVLYYTVYPKNNRPGSPVFTPITLNFLCDCSGGNFNSCGGGACTHGKDQKWQKMDHAGDLTQLGTGDYVLELYYQISGSNTSGNCDEFSYESNGGGNFTAEFSIASPTAVNFSGLKGSAIGNAVQLKWSIENDVDVVSYDVQRSANSIDFQLLNTVSSKKSARPFEYSYTDLSPVTGNNFYRLKLNKSNGGVTYSGILKLIYNKSANNIIIYPVNQQSNSVSIYLKSVEKGSYRLSILNALGQNLYSKALNHDGLDKQVTVDGVSSLSKGAYRLVLLGATGVYRSAFVVQ